MPGHRQWRLILAADEVTDDQCNALYEAGCDDGTISTSDGVTRIDFCRASPSLDDAIRSAISNVKAAGLRVSRVEIEADSLLAQ